MPLYVPDPDGLPADDLIEELGAEVANRYAGAEQSLVREIARRAYKIAQLEHAADTADLIKHQRAMMELAAVRATALREIRDIAMRTAADLRAAGLAERVMALAAERGQAAAAATLNLARRLPRTTTLTGTATQAVGSLVLDLHSKLEFLNARITRYPDDAYKQIMSEYSPRVLLGTDTSLLARRAAVQRFLSDGIDAFTDKAGRVWRIGSYAEMATRTSTQRGWQDAGIWRMQQSGVNLVTIRGGVDACKRCAPWIGKILSTDGSTGTVTLPHALSGDQVEIQIQGTIDQARSAGWGHPNDRCSVSAYLPGLAVPQAGFMYNAAAEQERAEQRRIEREIRAAKRNESIAPDDVARRRAQREIRDRQAEMRQFIGRTGRNRNSAREQLHFADGHK